MASRRQIVSANSVDYARHTGGWVYNSRVMRELAALGWDVVPLDLPAGFPRPDVMAKAQAARLLAALDDGALVIADQICLSPLAEIVAREAQRLRLVMIFHHPIARESGLADADRARFAEQERCALAACRNVVATSPSTAGALVAHYGVEPGRIVVARPGIERFAPSPFNELGVPLMLSVGAVIPRKGYHLLVEALAALGDEPWQLDIVGDLDRAPEYATRLREQVGRLGMGDRVKLEGGLSEVDLATKWRAAHIYVAASLHEGYGMAIAEAIARGLPTVTTSAGAVGDWLDPDAALIVPDDQPEALRTALARVLAEPALRARLRDAALDQAARFPSWADAARAVHERLVQL
jgi:glycosyltransferase involved in cell wall biosynthesis